ncbi:MAG: Mut7-C RNAse domain-containing protein [Kiritimatiellae bacterium]|nr:Mut7-C RNAse domain-containing protein [Kiritimatiellia bacterium]
MPSPCHAAPPHPTISSPPAFVIDHMLIRLGRWLRLCGYDAVWNPALRTRDLIRLANAEQRVFVTCNSHIRDNFPAPTQWVRLTASTPLPQFRELVSRLRLDPSAQAFSRCAVCNHPLVPADPSPAMEARLPPRVRERHPSLWRCESCDRLYWRGSHVERTARLLGLDPREPNGAPQPP